jgi:SAM-dependent methyltransferase
MPSPWEDPDWYDLHDVAWTAGSEREPEHYHELVLALAPLGAAHHVVDIGAGTGKLSVLIARGYPEIGRVTLVEPNEAKLRRARARVAEALPRARVEAVAAPAGEGRLALAADADLVIFGSVLMPPLEHSAMTWAEGLRWLDRVLGEAVAVLRPGGWLYAVETLANVFVTPSRDDRSRRLVLLELNERLAAAGLRDVECVYRFRDRVIVRGHAADAPGA